MEKLVAAIVQILYSMFLKKVSVFPTKLIPALNFVVSIGFLLLYYHYVGGDEFINMINDKLIIDTIIMTGLTTGTYSGVKNLTEYFNSTT